MKNFSINWENDEIVSIELNGEIYSSVEEIPDPGDRAAVTTLIDQHYLSMVEADFGTNFNKKFDKGFRQLERDSAWVTKFIVGIFLAIVLLSFAFCIISTVSIKRRLSREISTSGLVVDLVTRTGRDNILFYYPVVEFELADGSKQTVQLTTGSSNPQYVYGEVTILYEAERLNNARIASNDVWTPPIVTGLLGLAFLIPVIIIIWFTRPNSN